MKVTFNSLGQIVGAIDFEGQTLRQGMTDVVLKAVFQDKQNINYNAKFNLTRSDGTNITNVVMNLGTDSHTYIYALNDEWFLAKAGQYTLTVFLVDGNETQAATGQVQFTVQANDYDEDPETITEEQYNSLLAQVLGKASKSQVTLGFSSMPSSSEIQNLDAGQIFNVINGEKKLYSVRVVGGIKVADEIFDYSKFPDFTKEEIQDIVDELGEDLQQQIDDNKDDADAKFSAINDKIPSQASSSNKLVDRDTMNSSITQNASYFRGNFDTYEDLTSIEWQTTDEDEPYFVSNNDYAIVNEDENNDNECWRYKWSYDESEEVYKWNAEYKVNNTAFTSDQQKAINSGITTEKRVGYDGLDAKKQNKVYYNARPTSPQEGDIVVYPTTDNQKPIVAGEGIVFNTIDGITYISSRLWFKEVEVQFGAYGTSIRIVFITRSADSIDTLDKLKSKFGIILSVKYFEDFENDIGFNCFDWWKDNERMHFFYNDVYDDVFQKIELQVRFADVIDAGSVAEVTSLEL